MTTRRRPVSLAAVLTAITAAITAVAACGDGTPVVPDPPPPESSVRSLTVVQGEGQRLVAGRRSPEAFRIRALDGDGRPVADARVRFRVEGEGGGVLSQPLALTDADGLAESYLVEMESGESVLTATAGEGAATLPIVVERAPGELAFADPASGTAGLPGLPHPDSVVRVRVLDRRGRPMADREVWFAGPRELAPWADTTDAEGWASTVVRATRLEAGEGRIYAFLLDFPEILASTTRPVAAAADRVVLVSVDGLRADALERYRPPVLTRLAREGASTTRGLTVLPSLTTPAHLSLLSGVGPAAHGIHGDALAYTPEMVGLEPLFKVIAEEGLPSRAFMARGGPLEAFEEVLQCRLAFGLDSLTLVEPAAGEIAAAAAADVSDPDVRTVFVHLPDPDRAGHAHGFESPEYGEAVLAADAALGRLVDVLDDRTLLIVTSDHGGGGAYGSHLHGSGAEADVRIPLILRGPHVAPGDLGELSILDVAPTVLWALGLPVPSRYEGEPLLAGFRNESRRSGS